MLDRRRSPILKRDEATRHRSACMILSYLAQDILDLAKTAKHLAQRMVPLSRAARYLVGKPKAALRYRRQKHVDKITVFVDTFAGDPVPRKSTTGMVAQIGSHIAKSGSILQSLTAVSVGEAEYYAAVKGGQVGHVPRSGYWLDKEWKIFSECTLNVREVSGYAKKFQREHWSFLSPGNEEKWYATCIYNPGVKWDQEPSQMIQPFAQSGHPVFRGTSVFNRGNLKRKTGRNTNHFTGDSGKQRDNDAHNSLSKSALCLRSRCRVSVHTFLERVYWSEYVHFKRK